MWDFRFSRRRAWRWQPSGFAAPCSLVEVFRRFRDAFCLHHQGDDPVMMEAASTSSETSLNSYQTTRRNIPEDSYLHSGPVLSMTQLAGIFVMLGLFYVAICCLCGRTRMVVACNTFSRPSEPNFTTWIMATKINYGTGNNFRDFCRG
jgi:hypothetical protein